MSTRSTLTPLFSAAGPAARLARRQARLPAQFRAFSSVELIPEEPKSPRVLTDSVPGPKSKALVSVHSLDDGVDADHDSVCRSGQDPGCAYARYRRGLRKVARYINAAVPRAIGLTLPRQLYR